MVSSKLPLSVGMFSIHDDKWIDCLQNESYVCLLFV